MWRYLGLGVVVGLACGCTTPNPKSCADGACSDPALPFCDVDGAVAGSPMACIAVSCTPAEVAVCRGQQAVTCNAAGNDYDVIDCPMGCDVGVGGCRACANDDDCNGAAPICDASTNQCRGCALDSECDSAVCGQGACVDESSVVYASSTGSDVASGTFSDPSSIARAIQLATGGGGAPRIVRLLPGEYSTPLEVVAPTPMPLEIVATGATIRASLVAMNVRGGADVRIRGISATGGNQALLCGANGDLLTTLTVEDSVFFENTNVSSSLVVTVGCVVTMTRVESRSTTSGAGGMLFGTNTRFVGDRMLFRGRDTSVSTLGARVAVKVTNSVFDDVYVFFNTNDSQAPGSSAKFGFNTIVLDSPFRDMSCPASSSTAFLDALFENNIIVANGATAAVSGTACTFTNNVLLPQPDARPGNIVVDPQFVDIAARNFKLRATSPALGTAFNTPTIFTDHDFDGRGRPQGSAPDIGAYEQ